MTRRLSAEPIVYQEPTKPKRVEIMGPQAIELRSPPPKMDTTLPFRLQMADGRRSVKSVTFKHYPYWAGEWVSVERTTEDDRGFYVFIRSYIALADHHDADGDLHLNDIWRSPIEDVMSMVNFATKAGGIGNLIDLQNLTISMFMDLLKRLIYSKKLDPTDVVTTQAEIMQEEIEIRQFDVTDERERKQLERAHQALQAIKEQFRQGSEPEFPFLADGEDDDDC